MINVDQDLNILISKAYVANKTVFVPATIKEKVSEVNNQPKVSLQYVVHGKTTVQSYYVSSKFVSTCFYCESKVM